MQDRYAGDVGDFSKFALARALLREVGGTMGIIWYRFPNEAHNNDGRHINYFDRSKWIACDADLTSRLRGVAEGNRSIEALQCAAILPEGTRYYGDPLLAHGRSGWSRDEWIARALEAMQGCRTVIVDPDNGIAGPNHRVGARVGGKHITQAEIQLLSARHSCLVIYHHFDRSASHQSQASSKMAWLSSLVPEKFVTGLRYKRFSSRAYIIVADKSLERAVTAACAGLTRQPWDHHFEML